MNMLRDKFNSLSEWLAARSLKQLIIYFVIQTFVLIALLCIFIWLMFTR